MCTPRLSDYKSDLPPLPHLQAAFTKLDIAEGAKAPMENDVDGSRITRDLDFSYTPLEQTIVDMATSLIDAGIAVPRSKAAV